VLTEDAFENDVFALTSGIFLKLNHLACMLDSMHVKAVCNASSGNQLFFFCQTFSLVSGMYCKENVKVYTANQQQL